MIRKWNDFILESKNYREVKEICDHYDIRNWTLNNDGSLDINGDLDLSSMGLTKLPLKFNRVSGDFYCDDNQLTSLLGSPQEVGNLFSCTENKLTSLEGCPKKVKVFNCHNNKLVNLDGSPKGELDDFYCDFNDITSLIGSPKKVTGDFHCNFNALTDLVGAPEYIGRDFYSHGGYNKFYSFRGLEETFIVRNLTIPSPLDKVWELFRDKGEIETIMDYDPFRMVGGEPALDIDRLNQFLIDIGKDPVKEVEGWISI
jgi:hypothetical protein